MATPTAGGDCPRCGARYERFQEYCLECGLRLPADAGPREAVAAAVGRRSTRYPGDWVWPTLVALVVAVLTAVAAVAIAGASDPERPLLINATTTQPTVIPTTAPTTVATVPETVTLPEEEPPPAPRPPSPRPRPRPAPRVIDWPADRDGYTVVLSSVPQGGRQQATANARRALAAGLPQVGVLESSRYSSLHPGYLVVFSGVYRSLEQAQNASARARDRGYGDAYAAQVAR